MSDKITEIPRLLDRCIKENYDLTLSRGVFKLASEIDRELPPQIIDNLMMYITKSPPSLQSTLISMLPDVGLTKNSAGQQIPNISDIKVNELLIALLKNPASSQDTYAAISSVFLPCIKRCIGFLKTSTPETVNLPVLFVLLPLASDLSRLVRQSKEAFKFLGKSATILKNTLSKALESRMPVLAPFVPRIEEAIEKLNEAVNLKQTVSTVQEAPVEEVAVPAVPSFSLFDGVLLPTNLQMCNPQKVAGLVISKLMNFDEPPIDFVDFESRWANISHIFTVPSHLPAELSVAFPRQYDELEATRLEDAKNFIANSAERSEASAEKKRARVATTLLIPPNVRNPSLLRETLSAKAMERLPSPRVTQTETGHFLFKTALRMWTPNAAGFKILENRIFSSKFSDAKPEDTVHEICEVMDYLEENLKMHKFEEELASVPDESFLPYSINFFRDFPEPPQREILIEKVMKNLISKARQNISPLDATNLFIKLSESYPMISHYFLAVVLSLFEDFERAEYALYAAPLINQNLTPALSNAFLSVLCNLAVDPFLGLTTNYILEAINKISDQSISANNIIATRLASILTTIKASDELIEFYVQLLITFGEKFSLYDKAVIGIIAAGEKTYPKKFIATATDLAPEVATALLNSLRDINLEPSMYTMSLYFLASFSTEKDVALAARISQELCAKNGELVFKLPALFTLQDAELVSTIEKLLHSCPDLVPNFIVSALNKTADPIKTLQTILQANYASLEKVSSLMSQLFSLDMSLSDADIISLLHRAVYRAQIPLHVDVAIKTFSEKKPQNSKYIETFIQSTLSMRRMLSEDF